MSGRWILQYNSSRGPSWAEKSYNFCQKLAQTLHPFFPSQFLFALSLSRSLLLTAVVPYDTQNFMRKANEQIHFARRKRVDPVSE